MLTLMSRLPQSVVAKLEIVAREVLEIFADEGHTIDTALDANPAFLEEGGEARSWLRTQLFRRGVVIGAAKAHMECNQFRGGGRFIATWEGTTRYVFRLRSADQSEDGTFTIMKAGDPFAEMECEGMLVDEAWALGRTIVKGGGIRELFVAHVLDVTDETIPKLVLTDVTRLTGDTDGPTGDFIGGNDDLDLPDDDTGSAAVS